MPIIRIRTSEELYKINLESFIIPLKELKKLIHIQSNLPIEKMILSYDMAGENLILNDENTLEQLRLESGSLIFLLGRVIKSNFIKSTVDEKGQLINARNANDIVHDMNSDYYHNYLSYINEREISNKNDDINVNNNAAIMDTEKDMKIYADTNDFSVSENGDKIDSENVRSADPIRKMKLVDDYDLNLNESPIYSNTFNNDFEIDKNVITELINAGISQNELLSSVISEMFSNQQNLSYYNVKNNASRDFSLPDYIDDEEIQCQEELFKGYEENKKSYNEYEKIRRRKKSRDFYENDITNLVSINSSSNSWYEYISPSLLNK